MKKLIEKMNEVVSDWKAQFDITSKVQLEFRLSENDRLCLNEHEIHMPAGLSLLSADYNIENIKFGFDDTMKVLVIGIKWPEDTVPEVDTVRFGYESGM